MQLSRIEKAAFFALTHRLFLIRKLAAVQLGVEAVFRKQRFVVALLYDVAVAHDEDNIRFLFDGRQAVCDDERGASAHQLGKRALNAQLGTCIDGRRVASSRISIGGSVSMMREMHKKLFLSGGKAAAVFANLRIVAVRQLLNKKLCVCAAFAAAITSSSEASGRPMRMLSSTVPVFSHVSCRTMPKLRRSARRGIVCVFVPSTLMLPLSGS